MNFLFLIQQVSDPIVLELLYADVSITQSVNAMVGTLCEHQEGC